MNIRDITNLAAEAWNRVKAAGDPAFNDCAHSFREKLVHEAESVVRLRGLGQATNNPNAFEAAAEAILDERAAAERAAAATASESEASPPPAPVDPPVVNE